MANDFLGVRAVQRKLADMLRDRALVRGRISIFTNRRKLLERLFGTPRAPTRDGALFWLMLADEAHLGSLSIAADDRTETARAAERALINRLLAAWDGSEQDLTNLRARERELSEEIDDE